MLVVAVATILISRVVISMIVVVGAVVGMMMNIIMEVILNGLFTPEWHRFGRVSGKAVFTAV